MQQQPQPKTNVVWEPIPGSSQELALDSRCDVTLFHGARGPGKTITQLMRFRKRVGIGYGSFWRGVIFDKQAKNLDDIVTQSKRFFHQFNDGARFLSSRADYKWVWPTGEELLFRHAKKESDYDEYHGHEYPFIGFNELTKWANPKFYDKIGSTNRSSFDPVKHTPKKTMIGHNGGPPMEVEDEDGNPVYNTPDGKPLPPIPLEYFSTTNPNGPGHNWVKRRFINGAQPGEVIKTSMTVFDPRTQRDVVVTKTQVAIFGSGKENIYLDAKYIADLESIADENLKRSWLYGDWDVISGGAFDDLWKTGTHVLPRFKVPSNWRVYRSFDWASSQPFSVGWWALTNGEEVHLPDGRIFCPPPRSLIRIAEWYGTKALGTDQGLLMSATDIARGIVAREQNMREHGWISQLVTPGPADNQIRNVTEVETDTLEKKMNSEGVYWTKSDKSGGSRAIGFQLARDRLEAAIKQDNKSPHIYFMSNCKAAIDLLPSLPRDEDNPDDVDTEAEDHIWDDTRYMILHQPEPLATSVGINWS